MRSISINQLIIIRMSINKLKEIVDETPSMRPSVKRIVDVIFDHENIPRKKPKVCILIQ